MTKHAENEPDAARLRRQSRLAVHASNEDLIAPGLSGKGTVNDILMEKLTCSVLSRNSSLVSEL